MTSAVVIGSGPNGLAAAIRLAEAGCEVLVLEAADTPGGAVRTEELTLPGFLHDTFSAVYPAGAASPVFGRMPLHEHGLAWVHPEACSAHPLDGAPAAVLFCDLDMTVASLERQAPGDGEAWARLVTPFLTHFEGLRATMLTGFPPIGGPLRLLAGGGPKPLVELTRMLLGSAVGLGRRTFASPGSRAWLYAAAMHGDAPPGKAGSAVAAAYLNILGHAVGWPSPRGGAGQLAAALVSYLQSLGGELRTAARADAILARGGRVCAVRAGTEEFAADIVVADVMPHALDRLVADGLPSWYRAGLRRYVYGPATVKIDWALDGPIPWEDEAVRRAGTVHVGGAEPEFLRTIQESARGLASRPFLLLGQQSVADPTRAPEGKHTAWAYTHGPQHGVDWERELDAHVGRMEAQVERYAPGFRDRILARHVAGPGALQARNANLVGGDVGGGSYALRQVLFRPMPLPSPYWTPIRGLVLGSAATFPGGAVHGVPGDAAAALALRRSGRG